tara:strand:+ start:148 stop:720 length:573 start_codon:yes stop_codon:yes gene_type:complete
MTHIFNKYVRNAIEVSIDGYIDNLIDLKMEFAEKTDIDHIQHIGYKNLNRIKDWLKFDIENTQECLEESLASPYLHCNDQEKEMFQERLNDQKNALVMINNTLMYKILGGLGFEDSTSSNDICLNYSITTQNSQIKVFCPNDVKQNYDNELFNTYKCDIDDNDQFVNYTIFETKSLTEMLSFLKSNLNEL